MVGERARAAAKTATCVLPAVCTVSKLKLACCSALHVIKKAFKGLTPTLEINAGVLDKQGFDLYPLIRELTVSCILSCLNSDMQEQEIWI